MGNTIGTIFRVTSFGESHGASVGAVIDGCPSRLALSEPDIQQQLDRRKPGQSAFTSARNETDRVQILSGVQDGLTLGSPIALVVANVDKRPQDYRDIASVPRPSHADFTYRAKYGIGSSSGGGRASARETVGRVAAGAVAEKFLKVVHGVDIVAWVSSIGSVEARIPDVASLTRSQVDVSPVRCPVASDSEQMQAELTAAMGEHDSWGGTVSCVCRNVPVGWGDPVFDKLNALLAHAMMSIPAARGFEVGDGFAAVRMRGSEHNDPFVLRAGRLRTTTNHSGGIQGGISNGEPILFRVAFKPVASIGRPQKTVDYTGKPATLELTGRHDPCVVPRAVPVVEAMAALVLADAALLSSSSMIPPV